MRVAVINETSAADRNADILKALEGRGLEILNLGNTRGGETPELQYIHTGLMSALLLHLGAVDLVIGGCGTGIGYMNAVMQYPGVFCGHVLSPLDAWLFARINAGNCVSLALNQGYGWAGDVNLRLIFDNLFTDESGHGYPPHRAEPQRRSREMLEEVSRVTHHAMADIVAALPVEIARAALGFPAFRPLLESSLAADARLESSVRNVLS